MQDDNCTLCHRCQFSVWVYGVNRSHRTAERWAIDTIRKHKHRKPMNMKSTSTPTSKPTR